MEDLQRFVAGDLDAFESLFRQHQREVYCWVLRIVRDPAAAEDLTVEAFWRFYNARSRLDPKGNSTGWLRRVATNAAIDHLRRARRQTPLLADPVDEKQVDPVVQQQERAAIRRAFNELSPRLRIVAQLALIEGRPQVEIADALAISVGAVKLRLFRATRILRKKLEESGVTL